MKNWFINASEKKRKKLVSKYFDFLVEQYKFKYDGGFEFTSSKVRIKIQIGRLSPSTYVYRIGEPETEGLVLPRIIQFIEGRENIDDTFNVCYPDHPLEYKYRYEANILCKYADQIPDSIDEGWIPVHVFQYNLIEQDYIKRGQQDDFIPAIQTHHDYLKNKRVILKAIHCLAVAS